MLKPVQDVLFSCALRPSLPAALFGVKWITPFRALLEYSFGCWLKTYYTSKKCLVEIGNFYVHMFQLTLQYEIHICSVFGGVHDAARVLLPWRLCGRKGTRGRSGFDGSCIDRAPDSFV